MKKHLLCLGGGYVAQHLLQELALEGWDVTVTGRQFCAPIPPFATYIPYITPGPFAPELRKIFPLVTHLLSSIPPYGEDEEPVVQALHHVADDFKMMTWVGYFSATSVYGDHQGNWVTEQTVPQPVSASGRKRLFAESQWQGLKLNGAPVHIFRLAAIYGPERTIFREIELGQALRIHVPGHFFSRIHVADIVQILKASLQHPGRGVCFNVADDGPSSRRDLIEWTCRLMGRDYPPLVSLQTADLAPDMKENYRANKRVSNQYVKETFGLTLKYPTFREGLQALWQNTATQ